MSSLTGLFKATPEESKDSDKLLDLYWNRAELKKEFAALRDEKYKLQDRVKAHEGATARVQQKLDHLENLLLDPEWVHNVVTFYQLRRIGSHCAKQLSRFAEQIKQQREQRIHDKVLQSWDADRAADSAVVERKIGEVRLQVQLLEDQLQNVRHQLLTMNSISRMFRGSRTEREIQEIERTITAGQTEERELLCELDRNHNRTPPDHMGLSVSDKRSINFMILSFAQHLYLHFAEDDLASLAKEASEKSVGAINYGSRQDCGVIQTRVQQRLEAVDQLTDYAEVLQKRANKIAENAMFRGDEDVVPISGSVSSVFSFGTDGLTRERDGNILGENYFGVAKVLSR